MNYTNARQDPAADDWNGSTEGEAVREWYDANLMLVLPHNTDKRTLKNTRDISVEKARLNGREVVIDDPQFRHLLPQQVSTGISLAPIGEVKELIRNAASQPLP